MQSKCSCQDVYICDWMCDNRATHGRSSFCTVSTKNALSSFTTSLSGLLLFVAFYKISGGPRLLSGELVDSYVWLYDSVVLVQDLCCHLPSIYEVYDYIKILVHVYFHPLMNYNT